MKKQNIKPLVLSALGAVAMAGVGTGATFALFTDKAETQISVQAGVVDLTNEATIVSAYSLNQDDQNTVDTEGKNAAYVNGGTAKVTDEAVGTKTQTKTIKIEKWTPGDGIKLRTAPSNSSNVKTLVRLKIALSGELAPALEVRVRTAQSTGDPIIQGKGNRTIVTSWTPVEAGAAVAAYDVDVAFPNHGTDITAREEGQDNAYQGKSGSIAISYEAVQGNAVVDDLLERVNTKLASEEIVDGKANATMFDAFDDLAGILSAEEAKQQGFVWNFEDDQFYNASSVVGKKNTYFKVSDSIDASGFSIYASSAFSETSVPLTGIGFDAGNHTEIASVNYVGATDARTNLIRTNSSTTAVTVEAPNDTVRHFGTAGSVTIKGIAGNSYHEFGSVAFAEIAKGRIVLENESEIKRIHVNANATANGFDEIVIADKGAKAIPTAITRDEVEVNEAKVVVTIETESASETVYVYPYTKTGTTEKTTIQNVSVVSALGKLVLDNGNDAGEKAMSNDEKADVKNEVVNQAVAEEEAKVCYIGETPYATLAAAIEAASDNEETLITANRTIIITGNDGITIPAGKNIVIDLNGYTVKNQVNENRGSQLFKVVGTLTIKDSTDVNKDGTGAGLLTNSVEPGTQPGEWWSTPQRNYATNVITNTGTVNVESGRILQTAASSICYAVDNNSTKYDTTLNVTGGLLTSNGTTVRLFCNSVTNENNLNISGGTIHGNYTAVWIQLPGSNGQAKKASLNVSGGTLEASTYAFYDYSFGDIFDNTQYTITGGTFKGAIFSYGANFNISGGDFKGEVGIKQSKPSNVVVTGGTFAADCYTYGDKASKGFITGGTFLTKTCTVDEEVYDCDWMSLVADTHEIRDNSNGTWSVVAKENNSVLPL